METGAPAPSVAWRSFALLAHAFDTVGLSRLAALDADRRSRSDGDLAPLFERLEETRWTSSAIAVACDIGMLQAIETPLRLDDAGRRFGMPDPIALAIFDVLAASGLARRDGAYVHASPALAAMLRAGTTDRLRAAVAGPELHAADFARRAREGSLDLAGWRFTDAATIEAQGALTAAMVERSLDKLAYLPGLTSRLQEGGARLLDVGAGAGGLSITLCRAFPRLSAVALEPSSASADVAERDISNAGLSCRIEVRRMRIEAFEAVDGFDLAFLPQMFLDDAAFGDGALRVATALRPGGWLLAPTLAREGPHIGAAVSRLRALLWGGSERVGGTVKRVLQQAGFRPVIRAPGSGAIGMICARKPMSSSSRNDAASGRAERRAP